jgi:uncharacterized membrane protein
METVFHISTLTGMDLIALALLLVLFLGSGWVIENPPKGRVSVSVIMMDYRRDWMRTFVTRQPRIFDATLIDSLRQGTAFFASACMIAIGGGVALIGNSERVAGLAAELTLDAPGVLIEVKIILVIAFMANALLKFIWAHRLFGYCSILMAAVPNDPADPLAFHRAEQAAEVNITAAKSFNRGLRSIYFALGALGWMLGPIGLMVATGASAAVLLRREFTSQSRDVMLRR